MKKTLGTFQAATVSPENAAKQLDEIQTRMTKLRAIVTGFQPVINNQGSVLDTKTSSSVDKVKNDVQALKSDLNKFLGLILTGNASDTTNKYLMARASLLLSQTWDFSLKLIPTHVQKMLKAEDEYSSKVKSYSDRAARFGYTEKDLHLGKPAVDMVKEISSPQSINDYNK